MESSPRARVGELLERLQFILEAGGGATWVRRIRAARLLAADCDLDDGEALAEVSRIYHSMYGWTRDFNEFNVWPGSLEERLRANEELESIKDELWSLLDEGQGQST